MRQHFDHPLSANPPKRSVANPVLVGLAFVAVLFVASRLWAVDVPFSVTHTVDANFDGANSVFAADIDGDGDLDIIGIAAEADDVTWWENTNGDGSAWSRDTIDGNFDRAISVSVADIDGDGDMDVLGAAALADDITWWENTSGDGSTWTKHTVDGSFDFAISVFAADVDGDGDMDVLGAAIYDDDIAWWENTTGDGSTWTEHTVDGNFDFATSVFAADVDGDGDTDILGTAGNADDITWWENTSGDGSTWTEHTVDSSFDGARSVYAADIDGDGDTDVLGAAESADDITWWENTSGDGSTWTEHTVDAGFDGAWSVFAADVDGDGDTDVLGAGNLADDITWWENTSGDGSTWTEHTVDSNFDGTRSVHAADIDGDGDMDVLGAAITDDDITWWENTTLHGSALLIEEHTVDASFDGAISVFAADVDGDGDTDVLGAGDFDDDITWWENTSGDGSTWTKHTVDGSFDLAISVFAADVDGDGDTDVLGAGVLADEITWWENTSGDGSTWTEHTVDAGFDGAASVFAADVDGDGDTDVLGAGPADGITWWENTSGDGSTWTEHAVDSNFDAPHSVFATDVDGDGDTDVLGVSHLADQITWWENTSGDGSTWTEHTVDGNFDFATSVFAADVDGDGDTDILGTAHNADDITWWENTSGDGSTWTEHTVDSSFDGARSVYAADIDGDGDTDVLGAAEYADDITWWENTSGDGSTWTEHAVDAGFDGAWSVFAADVDGDGDMDVLGAAVWDDDDITWWENLGGQFALPTTDSAPAFILDGTINDLLAIEVTHRGRTGDTDLELTSFELLFEEAPDDPLTTGEANNLIQSLRIYLDDDDSGDFNAADPMVTSVDSLALDAAGTQTMNFVDGSPDVQVAFGTPRRYFVVVELTVDAASQTPNQFRVTHITESSSTAEDADHDIPLALEFSSNVASGTVVAMPAANVIFADGFESGDTSAWSSTVE